MRLLKATFIIYLISLHIFVFYSVITSDLREPLKKLLGTTTPIDNSFYKTTLAFQLRVDNNIEQNSIIFLGDSMIQGLCVTCVSKKAINFGIGGDTTDGLLQRIKRYQSVKHSDIVIIAIGVNDLETKRDENILINYNKILNYISPNVQILASSILPIDPTYAPSPHSNNKRIRTLNNQISMTCKSMPNCTYIDTHHLLINSSGNLRENLHIGDGIHLNSFGYALWIANLKGHIEFTERMSQ